MKPPKTDPNPYSTPSSFRGDSQTKSAVKPDLQSDSLSVIARRTFFDWEKLRVFYIAILTIVSIVALLCGKSLSQHRMEYWVELVFGVVVANLCYFLAPILETYVSWLGLPTRGLRIALFIAGTLFAGLLAVVTILTLQP